MLASDIVHTEASPLIIEIFYSLLGCAYVSLATAHFSKKSLPWVYVDLHVCARIRAREDILQTAVCLNGLISASWEPSVKFEGVLQASWLAWMGKVTTPKTMHGESVVKQTPTCYNTSIHPDWPPCQLIQANIITLCTKWSNFMSTFRFWEVPDSIILNKLFFFSPFEKEIEPQVLNTFLAAFCC